jgi:hypothetical protein
MNGVAWFVIGVGVLALAPIILVGIIIGTLFRMVFEWALWLLDVKETRHL